MSEHDTDQSTRVTFWVIGLIVAAVVISVMAYGARAALKPSVSSNSSSSTQIEGVAAAVADPALTSVYFETAQTTIDAAGQKALEQTIQAAAQDAQSLIMLSGYHDASGDAQQNAELAKQRAEAVKKLLTEGGIALERIQLQKPQVMVGDQDPKQARRVDITLLHVSHDHPHSQP